MPSISNQKIWTITLVVLGFLYLIFELAFNSRIVDGSSGIFDAVQLEAMELQGRILSGIGISLLLFRFANPDVLSKFFKQVFLIGGIGV